MEKIRYTFITFLLIACFCSWNLLAQSSTQNYVRTRTMTDLTGSTYVDNIQYFDGLGRPNQFIKVKQGNTGQDLVYLTEYDGIGRKEKEWLPGVFPQTPGEYRSPANVRTQSIAANANDSKPYNLTVYEPSPLSREKRLYGPGNSWQSIGRGHHHVFTTNTQAWSMRACIEFKVNASSVEMVRYYPDNMIYVQEVANEEDTHSFHFYDARGRMLLSRIESEYRSHSTYYVYDEYDNLRYVIPPVGGDIFDSRKVANDTDADVMNLFYIYKYDNRNRCIAKKFPGADWIYYIYDAADNLIFSQDGEQRSRSEWSFQIPDAMGRIVVTGICRNSLSYTTDPLSSVVVRATWAGTTNAYKGYTLNYTLNTPTILSVNYYDQYAFINYNGLPGSGFNPATQSEYGAPKTTGVKGLLTGQMKAVLGTTDFTACVNYYDSRDRLIHSRSKNHLGGIDDEWVSYTFDGLPEKRHQIHRAFSYTYPQSFRYEYDEGRRLGKIYHKWNNAKDEIFLAEYIYDSQGRLSIDVRDRSFSNVILKNYYTYDVRSRVTNTSDNYFIQNLTYSYGGNVIKYDWTMNGTKKAYQYSYDQMDRLLTATYTAGTGNYTNGYTYDKNGNIMTLTRYGYKAAGSYGEIDKLTYTRNGNQLKKVDDAIGTISSAYSYDFKDYVKQATEYTYNRNGAMTQDLNRGVTAIRYNALNLPTEIDIKSPVAEARNEYLYSADGRKLRVRHRWNPNYSTSPVIGSAVNVSSLSSTQTTDYVGDYVYVNNVLKRVMTPTGYIENGVYHFWVKDYLGSNRLVVSSSNVKTQWTDYYPFGMSFGETSNPNSQPYKYTDQEFDATHGLNLYDYHARFYDPAVGSFLTMDPLAEKYYNISPYAYCLNNPIKYIDPDGKDVWIYYQDSNGKEQRIGYTVGMNYNGNNEFVSKSISYLNAINNNGGSKMIGELIKSPNSFNIRNQIPVNKTGSAIDGTMQFDEFTSGGGNIYAGAMMKFNDYSNIESLSHELFHGIQHENSQGGASIYNEVEAHVYSEIIASKWINNNPDFIGSRSSNSLGRSSFEGIKYQKAFNNLTQSYSKEHFINAVNNFKTGAEKNRNGVYKNYDLRKPNQKNSILQNYYPQ